MFEICLFLLTHVCHTDRLELLGPDDVQTASAGKWLAKCQAVIKAKVELDPIGKSTSEEYDLSVQEQQLSGLNHPS